MSFEIIPALDILDGRIVRLVQGRVSLARVNHHASRSGRIA